MREKEGSSAEEENAEEGEVMDTPERGRNPQIATSIGKFEESPVFNFLNNLSPIKQVRSIHITQTINPLSFTSIPAVFTSPHVSSVKESRFLRRCQISDPSKPEFSSEKESNAGTSKVNMDAPMKIDEHEKHLERSAPESEVVGDQSFDCSKFVVECVEDPSNAGSSALVLFEPEAPQGLPQRNVVDMEGAIQIDQSKEGASSEWENLISGTSDLFIFESPNCTDSLKKSIDGMSFYASIENDIQNMHSLCAFSSEQVGEGSESDHISTQPGEGSEMAENVETDDAIAGPSLTNPGGKDFPGFYRGMRRRCLVFEIPGVRRKHLEENLGSDPSLFQPPDGNTSSSDQKVVSGSAGNDSSRHVLPAIGLHLNALATTPKGYKIVSHDSSAPGKLVIGPSSSVNFLPSNTSQELFDNSLALVPSSQEINGTGNSVLPMDDAGQGQASGYSANEEVNPSSPKKKRRRPDPAVEGDSCKRCNCKKSKCLKLYCECFAAGMFCVEPCACIDCFNKPIHEDTVLATRKQIESRNPLAFAPKVIKGSDSMADVGDDSTKTPASARHKRGCNCKKSGCLKKYCECYQGGVGCSINCRCEGCKNAYGRKEGSSLIPMETEAEEDKTDMNENTILDRREKAVAKIELDKANDSALPATPLRALRQSAHLPFSSKKKPPRSSFPSISSSSGINTHKGLGNPSFQQQPKFNNHVEVVREEMPEFLQEGSPVAGVKSTSPNQKRVSPPRSEGMRSPGLRSSRKLILQSIPSFPSLSQNQ